MCHTPAIVTAPAGTIINGDIFTVPLASTRNKLRTPPLWGVRTRSRLMHDGKSLTFEGAILRHAVEAEGVVHHFKALSPLQRNELLAFLASL